MAAKTNLNRKFAIKACSINICGMSSRSKFLLDKFSSDEDFDLVFAQETESTDKDKIELTNMCCITDNNSASNKGSAIYARNSHSITKLNEINEISREIDTSWGIIVINNKRFIVGSIYLKLNYLNGVKEFINMLNKANELKIKFKASGIIAVGDYNARHTLWGDKKDCTYGKKLVELLDITKFSICHANSPTFLCANGSSCIDFMIVSNNLVEKVESCSTDNIIELYSGAPDRGHVPFLTTLNVEGTAARNKAIEKINTDKIPWERWTNDLERKLEETNLSSETLKNPETLGKFIDETILSVTLQHAVKKRSSQHSKPFWTPELTRLCDKMRAARSKYRRRNTDANKEDLVTSKEEFDNAKKQECQSFIIGRTSKLNSAQALKFWKEFNLLFKKKTIQKIEPLFDKEGSLLTDSKEIEQLMFATFFEGQHLHEGNFDDYFYLETNRIYSKIISEQQLLENLECCEEINAEISVAEVKAAIKNYNACGKSSDKEHFNPIMFKHLKNKAISVICTLANLCLKQGKWIWDTAEVIFLKKNGKDTYSKPGSYRPISISAYIGKLIEKILTARIYKFLIDLELYDPNQEGFMPKRNTIRYLNRLINGIKSDKQNNLTTLCLFIDFEKAFDSIWKPGLLVKMYKMGIRGNILNLINDFLVNRKVTINVNGIVGNIRQSSDVGLPQGSALSPILFRIYLMDILTDLENNEKINIYKFADDGTIKVTGYSTEECLANMDLVIKSVENWVSKNRMIINCQPDKTEMICFSTAEKNKSLVPTSFQICGNEIKLVKQTKALGLIIDEDLNFIEHGKAVYKKLAKKWATICNYTHRHWGFNTQVMIQLIKTLFHSSLFYAGFIWINSKSIEEINKLYYHILKVTIGSVFNIWTSLAEMILGIPPIHILNQTNLTKHYLKIIINGTPGDKLKQFIIDELHKYGEDSVMHQPLKQVMKFLLWKSKVYPTTISEEDKQKIESLNVQEYIHLNTNSCKYTQTMMNCYVEHLWQSSIRNEFQFQGHSILPTPKVKPILIERGVPRDTEVLILSLFYENNLLNQFLNRYNPVVYPTPLCHCGIEEQTSHHLIFRCGLVNDELKSQAYAHFQKAVGTEMAPINSNITILNASRNASFMKSVSAIIRSIKNTLRTEIIL